ncbi:MAG TPA: hypothetical protein DCS93_41825 [Microscillaceae bacterium]|nr:hypothetical protein [Microscillaceae bacterium]
MHSQALLSCIFKTVTVFRHMKRVNVFKGYQLILWVFLSVVLITALILVFVQFQSRVLGEQTQIKTQVKESIANLAVLLGKARNGLYATRDELEFYLNNEQAQATSPLLSYAREDSSQQFFHLDNLPKKFQKKVGNLTGLGRLATDQPAIKQALSASLYVSPLLNSIMQKNSGATLAYAFFRKKSFINLHPFIPSKDFRFSPELLKLSYTAYPRSSPADKTKRSVKWTDIYQDDAGNGLMISAYIPFFIQDQEEGILGLDLTIDSLNATIARSQRELGTLFVTTRNQQLLAHPQLISSRDSILPVAAAFPKSIKEVSAKKYPGYVMNDFIIEGNYWIYSERIPNTSWKITYLVNYWEIYLSIFRDLGLNTAFILGTIFILLFFTNRYAQKRFISPATSLVEHIQNEHAHLPSKAYQVPKQWRHWFEVISKIFMENRSLVEELKVNNEELEYKVAKRTREVTTQNEELRQNQEEITSQRDYIATQNKTLKQKEEKIQQSLKAALTIQHALLPADYSFRAFFAHYFVIYRPRDVVSGDFYWLWQKSPTELTMMVGDCTGHGIPGAFMTMITSTLLDRITRINKVKEPAVILSNLHTEIKNVLRQEETNSNAGLEGIVLCMKKQSNTYAITYASARNRAFFITPDQEEIQSLECSRSFIGGVGKNARHFSNYTVTLPQNTLIYLGSDGYADQNDVDRRKIGRQRLTKVLQEVHQKELDEQKQMLEKYLEKHMKNTDQRDDILLVGIQL